MKINYTLALLITCVLTAWQCSSPKERTWKTVTTHNHETVICRPTHGWNLYPKWGKFPSKQENIRRIYMNISLGHPDSINIAHWDYLDPIRIKRVGGVNGKDLDLEIGKMLTPYGSNFKKDWEWTWRIDVTDFSSILRDSVEIAFNHTGYEAHTVGWDLTVRFDIEIGDPVANQVAYKEIYDAAYNYGKEDDPIEKSIAPQKIKMHPKAKFGRVRTLHTGHGMDGNRGCSEFCSRWREVLVDGETIDHRNMWKECGDNNLYPQGGTWIFDRAYWCPGDLPDPDMIDFKVSKESHTIDIEMEPYVTPDYKNANENLSAVLFQYEKPNKKFDVSIEQVLVPNKAQELNRLNPSNAEPKVVVKNLGSETITSLRFSYGTVGFETKEYIWKGELDFYNEAVITLPGLIDFKTGENTFTVEIDKVNNTTDQWLNDNKMISNFLSPKELPQNIVVIYKSNNSPKDNTIKIVDMENKSVFEKLPDDVEASKLYIDTLKLDLGRYRMSLTDTVHNGLEFWFMPKQGFGYLQINDLEGNVLHRFTSDCGVGEQLDFVVTPDAKRDSSVEQSLLQLHPRWVKDKTTLFVQLPEAKDGEVHILKDGEIQMKLFYEKLKNEEIDIDLSDYKDGRYVIEFFIEGESKLKQRISKRSKNR